MDKENLYEAGGVAWVDLYINKIDRIGVTCRANSGVEALNDLMTTIKWAGATYGLYPRNGGIDDNPIQDVPEAVQETISEEETDNVGDNLGLLDYPPKKSDLKFNQRFSIIVTQYTAKEGEECSFYQEGAKYPAHTHRINNQWGLSRWQEVFKNISFKPVTDGERHDVPGGRMEIGLRATDQDRQTSAGNPYVNLTWAKLVE